MSAGRRRNPTERLWEPSSGSGRPTIAVIDRGDPASDRAGVPFGFGRVLVDLNKVRAAEAAWLEHAEIVAGTIKC